MAELAENSGNVCEVLDHLAVLWQTSRNLDDTPPFATFASLGKISKKTVS